VYADRLRDVLLAANLQTGSYGYGILDGLSRAITGSWEIRMRSITDLNDAGAGRGPARLGVSPEELEVDDSVGRGSLNQLLEDWRPLDLLHSRHCVHTVKDLFLLNGVVPRLLLSTGNIVVHDPDHDILARQCKRIGGRTVSS
jgi:hypothetical protein